MAKQTYEVTARTFQAQPGIKFKLSDVNPASTGGLRSKHKAQKQLSRARKSMIASPRRGKKLDSWVMTEILDGSMAGGDKDLFQAWVTRVMLVVAGLYPLFIFLWLRRRFVLLCILMSFAWLALEAKRV